MLANINGWVMPWLAPMILVLLCLPLVDLALLGANYITAGSSACFANMQMNLTTVQCDAAFAYADFYYWNITNPSAFMAGTEPPVLEEVGPYIYTVHEERVNLVWYNDVVTHYRSKARITTTCMTLTFTTTTTPHTRGPNGQPMKTSACAPTCAAPTAALGAHRSTIPLRWSTVDFLLPERHCAPLFRVWMMTPFWWPSLARTMACDAGVTKWLPTSCRWLESASVYRSV